MRPIWNLIRGNRHDPEPAQPLSGAHIGQINQAVEQLDRNTQGAAATAEESASAAEELNAQSEQLHAVVDRLHGLVTGTSLQRAVRHGSSGLSDRGLHDLADSGAPRRQHA
ncbi:MAG: hypothetical protein ABR506_01500 [Candidatus Krumholzibacteriia bacterium]